jgi:hypothetical protein
MDGDADADTRKLKVLYTGLINKKKTEGIVGYLLHQPKGELIMISGWSGWTKKLIVDK